MTDSGAARERAAVSPADLARAFNQPGPAYGDSIGGMTIAGGSSGALFHRERTGEPRWWTCRCWAPARGPWRRRARRSPTGMALADAAIGSGRPLQPLVGTYRTSDDRFVSSFFMLQAFAYWADVCEHIGRPDLITDARFATAEALGKNPGPPRRSSRGDREEDAGR